MDVNTSAPPSARHFPAIGTVLEVVDYCGCGTPWFKIRNEANLDMWIALFHKENCPDLPSYNEWQ